MKTGIIQNMRVIFLLCLLFYSGRAWSQDSSGKIMEGTIRIKAEKTMFKDEMPSFPGGLEGLNQYFINNLKYPEAALLNKVQGKVIISFVVSKDGTLKDVRVAKKVSEDIDAEAIRVISAMPRWITGFKNGEPISTKFSVPITFSLK
jgi:TonB family protein